MSGEAITAGSRASAGGFDKAAPAADAGLAEYRTVSKTAAVALLLAILAAPFVLFTLLLDEMFFFAIGLPLVAAAIAVFSLVKIARNPHELTGRFFAFPALGLAALVFIGGAAWYGIVYATEVPPGTDERISFYDLRPSKSQTDLPVPHEILKLDGKKVFIKGYVHPSVSGRGPVKNCILVGDKGTCCFGGQPKLTDMIEVKMLGNLGIEYNQRRRKLRGTLKIDKEFKPPDGSQGVHYKLEVDWLR